ncbi:hypothetical protein COOONC_03058, partial [Cooperia oncophora]
MSMSTTSMVTSLISPLNEKLCGIDEEICTKNEVLPVRSSTVPETLNSTAGGDAVYTSDVSNGNLSVTSVLTTSSILSSSSTDEENRPADMDILQLNNNPQLGKEKLYLGRSLTSSPVMMTSLISPLNEKLCGIDEEICTKNEVLPVRSSTVPETLNSTAGGDA